MSSLDETLRGYTLRRLPNLADRRNLDSQRLALERRFSTAAAPKDDDERWRLRAAAARLISAYADADDILVGRTDGDGRMTVARIRARRGDDSTLTRAEYQATLREGLEGSKSWSDQELNDATAKADLSLSPGESPALFSFSETPSDTYPRNGLVLETLPDGLRLVADAASMSEAAAEVLLSQIETFFKHWRADDSPVMDGTGSALGGYSSLPDVPESTLSAFNPPFDAQREHLPDEWLALNARQRPNAVAHEIYDEPEDEARILTYGHLHEESGRLASWLRDVKKVKDEDRIGVCRRRDEGFYIAMAAILRAGCCYVPIDIDLPLERKRYIAEDSSASLILTDAEHVESGDFNGFEAVDVGTDPHRSQPKADFVSLAKMDGLAYILYTSGTTGKPKGCMQLNRGLFWAIDAIVDMPRSITDPDKDKRLALAAVAFDVHISEIVQSWALGTRLVSVGSRLSLLASLQETVERLGITHVGMVPSMIEATLTKSPEDLPIKYMVSGGEKCSDAVLSKWAANPKVLFANFYGPTEATIGCTARRVDGPKDRHDNIGRTFPATSAYVVDDRMRILPRGTAGELIIEGALVGRGYVNLPDATKKSFLEWPEKGRRAYRTGDLVRMAADGSILIMGRIDSQIKLRGVRIESEGVSAVIRDASGDRLPLDAVTAVCKHPSLGQAEVLVTFVAPKESGLSPTERRKAPSLSKLPGDIMALVKDGAARNLASYMRPAHIIPCTFLPLSHNGKVDVKPLQALFRDTSMDELAAVQGVEERAGKKDGATKPLNDAEKRLVGIIEELLSRPLRVGPKHTLIEAGLGSLDMTRLAAKLSAQTGRRLRAHDLFAAGSIAKCAALLEGDEGEASSDELDLAAFDRKHRSQVEAAFEGDRIQHILPPLPVQPGILFSILQDPSRYVQHFLYEIAEDVTAEQLRSAFDAATRKHDMLRAAFFLPEDGDEPVLAVREEVETPFKEIDEECSDAVAHFKNDVAPALARKINALVHTGPLWSAQLHGSRLLSVSLSHLVYDHGAVVSLMRQVDTALRGDDVTTPAATLSDVVSCLGDPDSEKHRSFWTRFLAPLKGKSRTPLASSPTHVKVRHSLRSSLAQTTASTARLGLTMQALLNAAFALASAEHLDVQRHAVFGNVRSGRDLPVEGAETAICPLVTVVPMIVRLDGSTPAEVCRSAQDALVATLPHEHVPLGLIQRWAGVRNLIECVVSCRHARKGAYEKLKHVPSDPPAPEFPLAIELLLDEEADAMTMTASAAEPLRERVEMLLPAVDKWMERLLQGGVAAASTLSPEGSDVEEDADGDAEEHKPLPDAPQHLVDAVLDEIRKLLDVENVGPASSLISLGMASLKAVALSKRLSKRGLKVAALDIIAADTAVGVAASVKEDGGTREAVALKRPSTSGPCTPLQSGMLAQTVASEGSLYVHAFVLRHEDGVEMESVRRAWIEAAAAFDILRTRFRYSDDGDWTQEVVEDAALPWRADVVRSDSPQAMAKAAIQALDLRDVSALSSPPWALFPVANDVSLLVVALHHALYDGVSLDTLLGHVAGALGGTSIPATPPFLPIAREIASLSDEGVQYFARRLEGAELPARLVSQQSDDVSSATWRSSRRLSPSLSTSLVSLSRSSKASVQSIAQLGLAQTLSQRNSTPDVVFCQVMSGRTMEGAVDVVGPTFNTIPVRVRLAKGDSHKKALSAIHRDNNAALRWQHAPLRGVQRAVGAAPLADVLFVFQPNLGGGESKRPWTLLKTSDPDQGSGTHFALNVEVHEREEGIAIFTSASAAVLSQEELNRLVEEMEKTLKRIVDAPDEPSTKLEQRASGGKQSGDDVASTPLTSAQKELLTLMAETLGVAEKDAKLNSPPAAIGLDSITAIRLSSRAKSRLDIRLTPSEIFKAPSVRAVLDKIGQSKASGGKESIPPSLLSLALPPAIEKALRGSIDEDLRTDVKISRCSGGMDLLFSMWQSSSGVNSQMALIRQARQRLDVAKLKGAWESLLSRHDVLRSFVLPTGEDEPRTALCIAAPGNGGNRFEEVNLDTDDEVKAAQQLARSLLLTPLSAGRPASRLLLAHGSRSDFVVFNLPHVQYDAGSLPLLIADLEALYSGKEPTSCADLLGFQAAAVGDDKVNAARREYWRKRLAGVKPLPPPTSRSVPPLVVRRDVEVALSDIAGVASSAQVSLGSVVLAAYAAAQAELSGSMSATFGLFKGGRSSGHSEISSLAAPTVNVVPMRVDISKDILATAASIDAISRQQPDDADHTRLSDIARWIGHPRQRLFDVSVNVLLGGAQAKPKESELWTPVKVPYEFTPAETAQYADAVKDNLRTGDETTTFPEHDVDMDLAIREVASDESASTLRLFAEIADGRREEKDVKRLLDRVAEFLDGVVGAKRQ